MKLVISIPDFVYDDVRALKGKNLVRMNGDAMHDAIYNATPFDSVIENIKTEIENIREDVLHSTSDYSPNEVLDIIDDILCRL